jgi:hypothetical protein
MMDDPGTFFRTTLSVAALRTATADADARRKRTRRIAVAPFFAVAFFRMLPPSPGRPVR